MLVQPTINMLVVENDITNMRRCRELLLDQGHKVRTAESIEEALQIVQKQPGDVDIMLLSLELPGWGGMTLIETLQRARREILIMSMSANCAEEAMEAMQAGAYDYLVKPLDLAAITYANGRYTLPLGLTVRNAGGAASAGFQVRLSDNGGWSTLRDVDPLGPDSSVVLHLDWDITNILVAGEIGKRAESAAASNRKEVGM